MDLLPACTYSQNMYEQYLNVLQCIKSYPENYSSYSSSLGEIQKQFLKDQLGTTHQLIRLIKYWYKSLTLDVDIYGGSYIMEVLCVTVCNESKTKELFTNFKAALQKISQIDTLRIAFLFENDIKNKLKWTLISDDALEEHKNSFSSFILQRSNFIIDPSNPYNDLFNPKNLTETVISKLKGHASEMVERMEILESVESNELKTVTTHLNNPSIKFHIDKFLEPHSMSLNGRYDEGIPNEIVYHVDYKFKNSDQLQSASICCPSTSFFVLNKQAKKVSKTILTNLVFLIRAKARLEERQREGENFLRKKYIYKDGLADVSDIDHIKEAVAKLIEHNDFESVRKSSSNKCHNKCDVTLYVPYVCNGMKFYVRFSMKWKGKEINNFNKKKCCVIS